MGRTSESLPIWRDSREISACRQRRAVTRLETVYRIPLQIFPRHRIFLEISGFFAVLKWNWVEAVADLIETRNGQRKVGLPLRFRPRKKYPRGRSIISNTAGWAGLRRCQRSMIYLPAYQILAQCIIDDGLQRISDSLALTSRNARNRLNSLRCSQRTGQRIKTSHRTPISSKCLGG